MAMKSMMKKSMMKKSGMKKAAMKKSMMKKSGKGNAWIQSIAEARKQLKITGKMTEL